VTAAALLDSNVVVATVAEQHEHHRASLDLFIGESAVIHGVPVIITWNTGHMRGLFPTLTVATPVEFIIR
jgi:hypothetical protein